MTLRPLDLRFHGLRLVRRRPLIGEFDGTRSLAIFIIVLNLALDRLKKKVILDKPSLQIVKLTVPGITDEAGVTALDSVLSLPILFNLLSNTLESTKIESLLVIGDIGTFCEGGGLGDDLERATVDEGGAMSILSCLVTPSDGAGRWALNRNP